MHIARRGRDRAAPARGKRHGPEATCKDGRETISPSCTKRRRCERPAAGPALASSRATCPRSVPPFSVLESHEVVAVQARLVRVRSQVAIIRTLADHIETLSRVADADAVAEQVIEELARLGCRLLETAAALAGPPAPTDSGVFERRLKPA